jgi:hypothetical protein
MIVLALKAWISYFGCLSFGLCMFSGHHLTYVVGAFPGNL